jgi:hypothetical protein
VSRSKTAIEKPGREYLKRLKKLCARRGGKRFVDACDELRDATAASPEMGSRAGALRLKSHERDARRSAGNERKFDRQLAAQIEADHEMALLMNKGN